MNLKCFLLFAWVISLASSLSAQQPATDTLNLHEVVVTTSKTPQSLSHLTQKMDVIDAREMEFMISGNRNLSELMLYKPGAFVSALSRNDANWGSYGGIGPKYSTYMLQGLPIDAFVDPMVLDLNAFERVEVQRGPASVLYPNYLSQDFAGNQSPLAGTVNFILRDRTDQPLTSVSAAYGSYNTLNGSAFHENQIGNLHLMGSLNIEKSDYTDYGSPGSWLNMIDNPEYQKTKLFVGGTWHLNPEKNQKIDFFANQTWHSGDAGRPNRGFKHAYSLLHFGYSGDITDKLGMGLKLGYRNYKRSSEEDNFHLNDLSLRETDDVNQSILPVDLYLTYKSGKISRFIVGGEFQLANYNTNALPVNGVETTGNDAQVSQFGIYAQEELTFGKTVLRGGLKYVTVNNDIALLGGSAPVDKKRSWDVVLWNAGMKYNANENFSPFLNVGTSFMAPGLKSVGGTVAPGDTLTSGQLPNPDLKPEKGTGLDFGFDYRINPATIFTARYFYYGIDDAIVENSVRNNGTTSQSKSVNAGKTIAKGFEMELKQRIGGSLQWFANYTFFQTEVANRFDPDQDGSNLPFVPDQVANFGLTAWLPWQITVSPYIHLAGRIYDSSSKSGRRLYSSYELLNLDIHKKISLSDKTSLVAFVRFYNLTNNRFEMPWQFQDPGFSMMAGVKATF